MENNFQLSSAAVSDRGLSEKRPQNEDSYLELEEYGVFAVADGVGGAQAGDVASQMAVEILGEAFINQPPGADPEEVMKAAIEQANAAVFQMASDLPQLSTMASTIAAVQLSGNIATIGHVGDSRVYRFDPHGQLHRETADHSVVEEEVRAGRMTPEQAASHPSRNVISRAVGAEREVDVELKTIMVEPGTSFLICSDGITRHIDDSELRSLFTADAEPADLCTRMKELCYSRGAEDNLTAVIVRVSSATMSAAASQNRLRQGATSSPPTNWPPANAGGSDHPDEADTIATARPPFENSLESEVLSHEQEIPTQDSRLTTQDYASTSVVVPAQTASYEREPFSYHEDARPSRGIFGSLIKSFFLLLLGAVLGAGGYYLWLQSITPPVVETPVIQEMKSGNVALTAFEESRRQVDADPAKYINAKAASPQEAEDYFLLGRAFLLTGKNWEAKRAFNEAKNRLAQVDPNNAKTLAAEISMALAIIESPGASEMFTRDRTNANVSSNTNVNTNSNQ